MNDICAQVLDLAKRQIGDKETGKNETKYARFFDNEAWQWFNTKKQGAEWCAIFICWLFAQNETLGQKQALSFLGCPAPKNNCSAGCGYLYYYMNAKCYKSDIQKVKPGDIVFFKSGSKCSHVGIAESVSGGKVITIEGNKDNQVKRVTHNISSNIYFGVMSLDWDKARFYEKKEEPAPDPLPSKPEYPAAPTDELKAGQLMIVSIKYASSELMLRAYPSGSAPVIQRMKKGWKVTYLGERSGSWLKVRCNNVIGWACEKEASKNYYYLTKA